MKRNPQSRAAPGVARAVKADDSAALLDSLCLEALERLTGLLARNGIEESAIERAFRRACDKHHRRKRVAQPDSVDAQYEASLVLAAWYTDLDYLDAEGRPRRLPLNGTEPSLKSLIERAGLTVAPRDMARRLEHIKAIRQVGQDYAPLRRARPIHGAGSLASREMLRFVVRLLRSLDENTAHRRAGNLDDVNVVTALESTEIPVRLRRLVKAQLARDMQQFVREVESRMLRHERSRVSGEPLMHTGIGVFHFEDALPEAVHRAPRREKARRVPRATAGPRAR